MELRAPEYNNDQEIYWTLIEDKIFENVLKAM